MKFKVGDICLVIGGALNAKNIGAKVRVLRVNEHDAHSKLGNMYHCIGIDRELITEYGVIGREADFAESWLMKIEPDDPNAANDAVYHDDKAAA